MSLFVLIVIMKHRHVYEVVGNKEIDQLMIPKKGKPIYVGMIFAVYNWYVSLRRHMKSLKINYNEFMLFH